MQRQQVLSLYRQILRLARSWPSRVGGDQQASAEAAAYIRQEAGSLFRQHRRETDPAVIDACVKEAQSRISLALHYNTPYPRMPNLPPNTLVAPAKAKRRTARAMAEALPSYMRSYADYSPKIKH